MSPSSSPRNSSWHPKIPKRSCAGCGGSGSSKRRINPTAISFPAAIFKNPAPEVSAGTLIDQAGLKGSRFGEAEVSDRHANFIVAHPGAKTSDVLELIERVRQRVWQQFGYELELQIQVW